MPLGDLTDDIGLIEIAQSHSRMVEVAIIRGNSAMAHRAVDRAFESLGQYQTKLSRDSSLAALLDERLTQILTGAGISTIGQLCELSRDTLVSIYQIRYRSADTIERALAKHGFALRRS